MIVSDANLGARMQAATRLLRPTVCLGKAPRAKAGHESPCMQLGLETANLRVLRQADTLANRNGRDVANRRLNGRLRSVEEPV
jgi:hypothetical protein